MLDFDYFKKLTGLLQITFIYTYTCVEKNQELIFSC